MGAHPGSWVKPTLGSWGGGGQGRTPAHRETSPRRTMNGRNWVRSKPRQRAARTASVRASERAELGTCEEELLLVALLWMDRRAEHDDGGRSAGKGASAEHDDGGRSAGKGASGERVHHPWRRGTYLGAAWAVLVESLRAGRSGWPRRAIPTVMYGEAVHHGSGED